MLSRNDAQFFEVNVDESESEEWPIFATFHPFRSRVRFSIIQECFSRSPRREQQRHTIGLKCCSERGDMGDGSRVGRVRGPRLVDSSTQRRYRFFIPYHTVGLYSHRLQNPSFPVDYPSRRRPVGRFHVPPSAVVVFPSSLCGPIGSAGSDLLRHGRSGVRRSI